MKKNMPLEGLRWSRDSGSALYDTPQTAVLGRAGGGVPAKIIKYRCSTDDIKYLCNLKWWNKPIDWLEQNHNLFIDIDALKKYANV